MRSLERNKQDIWYCNVLGKTDITNSNGDCVGSIDLLSNPTKYSIGVSATVGSPKFLSFGVNQEYSREMSCCDDDFSLNEGDLLFIDIEPQVNSDGSLSKNQDGRYTTEPDYYVKKVIKSQNSSNKRYGISKKE